MYYRLMKRGLRCCGLTLATLIIAVAVILNVVRAFSPILDKSHRFFEAWVSEAFHQPVHISKVRFSWYGDEPVFDFVGVTLIDPKQQHDLLKIQHLRVSINLWHSLLSRQLLPGQLIISGTQLDIYQLGDGRFRVRGVTGLDGQHTLTGDLGYIRDLVQWMLTQSHTSLSDINIRYHPLLQKPVQINNVKLKITNRDGQHYIVALANMLHLKKNSQLRVVAKILNPDIQGQHLAANVYIRAKNIALKPLLDHQLIMRHIPQLKSLAGRIDARIWLKVRHEKLHQVQATAEAEALNFVLNNHQRSEEKIPYLFANFLWQKQQQGWQLGVDHLRMSYLQQRFTEQGFGLRFMRSKNNKTTLFTHFDTLRLADVGRLLQHFQLTTLKHKLHYTQLNPQGDFDNFNLRYTYNEQHQVESYYLLTHFNHLTTQAWQKFPGIENLAGSVELSRDQGRLHLNTQKSALNFPHIFKHKLALSAVNADVSWRKYKDSWQVLAKQLAISTQSAKATGYIKLTLNKQQKSPTIDTALNFSLADAAKFKDYLPSKILHPHLNHWLQDAFVHGSVSNGRLVWHGELAQFPYTQHTGLFDLSLAVKDLDFHYADHWPNIHNMQGELHFSGKRLDMQGHSGDVMGTQLSHIKASFADLTRPELIVTGLAQGDLQAGRQFLLATPLSVRKKLTDLSMQGPMDLLLKLKVNLHIPHHKPEATVSGDIKTHAAEFKMPAWGIDINHIQGQFQFADNALYARQVKGELFGEPITLAVNTWRVTPKHTLMQYSMGGQVSAAKLRERLHLPILQYFSGETNYRALLTIHDDQQKMPDTLSIASDLQGMAINLPKPFTKKTKASRPLSVKLTLDADKPTYLQVRLANLMSIKSSFDKREGKLHFIAGNVHLGAGQAKFQKQPGFLFDGSLASFAWQDWKNIITPWTYLSGDQAKKAANVDDYGLKLRKVAFNFNRLTFADYTFSNLLFETSITQQGLKLALMGPEVNGYILIPHNKDKTWQARFERIHLQTKVSSKAAQKNTPLSTIKPTQIPNLDFTCQDCQVGKKRYGQVALKLKKREQGVRIERLAISNKLFKVAADGSWLLKHGKQITKLTGGFGVRDLGQFFRIWGDTKALEDGYGHVRFNLNWQGSPMQFSLPTLNGLLDVKFYAGRIVKLSKSTEAKVGLGKVLNLLSLQTLPFGLANLAEKGFAFNTLNGSLNFTNGNADIKNGALVGSIAWVRFGGKVNFVKHHYDLKLNVTPNITSSLPLVVGIAGGPLAGAIAWIVNKILARPIGKIASNTYLVEGSWQKPNIVKLNGQLPAPKYTKRWKQ